MAPKEIKPSCEIEFDSKIEYFERLAELVFTRPLT
jgi:hypothetical protein